MTTTTRTIADFLLARVSEDEAAVRDRVRDEDALALVLGDRHRMSQLTADAILRTVRDHDRFPHDPARVLAECEAKRAIVQQCVGMIEVSRIVGDEDLGGAAALRALAAVYADHPDFDPAWR